MNPSFRRLKQRTDNIINFVSSDRFFRLTLILFALQALFYVLTIKFGTPPDERYHFQVTQVFTQDGLSPFIDNQTGLFNLGELTRIPYLLYHYLLSFPLWLMGGLPESVQIFGLRLINVVLSILSLIVLRGVGRELKFPNFSVNMTVFLFSGSMMYTFLSGAINYDNLFILLAFLSFWLLIKLVRNKSANWLALWILVTLAGTLTKEPYLPIAAAQAFVILIMLNKALLTVLKEWLTKLKNQERNQILLTLAILPLLFMFSKTHIANLIEYQDSSPSCVAVHSHEECLGHALYRRALILEERRPTDFKLDLVGFALGWSEEMTDSTLGTLSHNSIKPLDSLVIVMKLLFIVALAAVIRKINAKNKLQIIVLALAMFYALVLLYTNFGAYEKNARVIAVQARYLFPVLPIFYFIGLRYMEETRFSKALKCGIVFIVLPLMFIGNIPTYLYHADSSHYSDFALQFYQLMQGFR